MGYLIASVAATNKTATSAKCVVSIPYSWLLFHPSLRSSEPGHFRLRHQPTAGSLGLPTRTSTQTVGAIRVPANGETTPEAVKRNDMTIDGHWSRGLVFVTL